MPRKPERVFVIRIWWEPHQPQPLWRASLTSAGTYERHHFAVPAELLRFLEGSDAPVGASDAGNERLPEPPG